MNKAENIFRTISGFNQQKTLNKTPQESLVDYCKNVLGNIENYHYDFKEKHDSRCSKLEIDDEKNLAKAVSGFANSAGGVLVWGLKNKTLEPKPISNVKEFVSSILQKSPQIADPTVPGIEGDWLKADTNDPNEGFGIIYIPESSLPPHRVSLKNKDIQNHYYIRSGEDFMVMSHTQLEDMFGRRPKPLLSLTKRFNIRSLPADTGFMGEINVFLGIRNDGRGSARAPLLALTIGKPYEIYKYGIDGNMNYGLTKVTQALDIHEESFCTSDFILHSGLYREVVKVVVKINKDMENGKVAVPELVIDYKIAAEGVGLIQDQQIVSGTLLLAELKKVTSTLSP